LYGIPREIPDYRSIFNHTITNSTLILASFDQQIIDILNYFANISIQNNYLNQILQKYSRIYVMA